MAMTLHLYVPEDEWDEDVIEAYYDHVFEKHQQVDPDVDRVESSHEKTKRRDIEKFQETGEIHIMHRGWTDYPVTEAWDEFFEILETGTEPSDGDQLEPITDEETLEELVVLLREMKGELKEMGGGPERSDGLEYTPEDREREFEVGPIALVEFALDHGYGVTMDY